MEERGAVFIVLIIAFLIAFSISVWVFKDATSKGRNLGVALLWFVGTLFLFIPFFPLWIIVRNFKLSENALRQNVTLCANCGKYYEGTPSYCPNCGIFLTTKSKVKQRAQTDEAINRQAFVAENESIKQAKLAETIEHLKEISTTNNSVNPKMKRFIYKMSWEQFSAGDIFKLWILFVMGAAAMFFFKTLWFGVISIACSGIYFYVTIKKYSNQIITAWEIKASQDNNPKINIDN